ncbi:MAG: hypothetical protein IT372_03230 [Polyangiaceae bacterium]|nr:hypothetical protein [Polyangiaceae bacterium]
MAAPVPAPVSEPAPASASASASASEPVSAPAPASASASASVPVSAPASPSSDFDERLVLDIGRTPSPRPDPETVSFILRGEYEMRFRALSDLRLEPPLSDPASTALGQNAYLYHWLRLSPRFQYRDNVAIVGQIDLARGMVIGDATRHVEQVRDSLSEARWYEIHPRQLYLELATPVGLFRIGMQTSHWGMGIVVNDGDHPSRFGDYQRGALVERILFATTPMGKGTPLTLVLAGDLVFEDNTADLLGNDVPEPAASPGGDAVPPGDRAYRAVAALLWRERRGEVGFYGALRHQERDRLAAGGLTPLTEELTAGLIDLAGRFHAAIPGADAFLFGEVEGAVIVGSTTYSRTLAAQAIDPTAPADPEIIRSYGGALTLGAVHPSGRGDDRRGELVTEVELGYASGDADPHDGVMRRFTFDTSHNVGLVLFDHVLAWKTARAATIAQDPAIAARPAPGLELLPTRGGVAGAAYVNPRAVYRPVRGLDLKAGLLVAQATADLGDPYHAGALGEIANYDGGDERAHDLGVEIDLGAEGYLRVDERTAIQLGVEGGVLVPGRAFDDAAGEPLANQYLLNTKLGVVF